MMAHQSGSYDWQNGAGMHALLMPQTQYEWTQISRYKRYKTSCSPPDSPAVPRFIYLYLHGFAVPDVSNVNYM